MKYHFKIHKEGMGYWAHGIELPTCVTQAKTLPKLYKNMEEALNLHIDEPADSLDFAPLPDSSIKLRKNIVEVPVDPAIALAFLMRYNRIKNGITQQEAARKMGFSRIFSYQRLESGKCNPSLQLLARIVKAFPNFSVDLALDVKA